MFGDLKTLSTSKVTSRLRTKSALSSVDETPIAMAVSVKHSFNHASHQNCTIEPRTDKSPNAPCVLKEHWLYPHTNRVCSKQRCMNSSRQPTTQNNSSSGSQISDEEKIKRYNRLAAAGVIGYSTEAPQANGTAPATIAPSPSPDTSANCQLATSYNTTVKQSSKDGSLIVFAE